MFGLFPVKGMAGFRIDYQRHCCDRLNVITALTIAFIPVGLLGLEVMLNAIQALIFSVLTLIFITLAIESHEHEEGHVADEAMEAIHDTEASALQPAH